MKIIFAHAGNMGTLVMTSTKKYIFIHMPILPAHAGNMGTLVMTSTFEYCRQGGW